MLRIFNDLEPFFTDSYRRLGIREYARIAKISPPSASTLLNGLYKEGLLIREEDKKYILFAANRENDIFVNLSIIYWSIQIKKSGLIDNLKKDLFNPVIILFGSFSKAEIKEDSDIDIALFNAPERKLHPVNTILVEHKLKHKLQIFHFKSRESVNNKELLNNVLNGFILFGSW